MVAGARFGAVQWASFASATRTYARSSVQPRRRHAGMDILSRRKTCVLTKGRPAGAAVSAAASARRHSAVGRKLQLSTQIWVSRGIRLAALSMIAHAGLGC